MKHNFKTLDEINEYLSDIKEELHERELELETTTKDEEVGGENHYQNLLDAISNIKKNIYNTNKLRAAKIEQMIEDKEITTDELFLDWLEYMHEREYDEVEDYAEHFENLLSHEENEVKFREFNGEMVDYCILCESAFVIGETGNELGFCCDCSNAEDFPYDLDAYYKAYENNEVAFKGFDTKERGLLEKFRK